ncbi:MAG: uroporphyrinogen-III synthase [Cyanothece sp. SIO2G6]|nr:uroporphyrinogen-III synthase [Cyanothece sp. SIO2G6]
MSLIFFGGQCVVLEVAGEGSLPLSGQTILVTRAAGQSGTFGDRLRSHGATVVEMPALEIGPPSSWAALDEAIATLHTFDWLILTSANGVNATFDRLQHNGYPPNKLESIKIAVVGKKTAQSLRKRGYEPDFIPPDFVADSLVSHFPDQDQLAQMRLLFPRVETGGRDVLVKEFTTQGATVIEVPAYQSQCPATIDAHALAALQTNAINAITFASSKTVRCFHHLLTEAGIPGSSTQHPDEESDADLDPWHSLLASVCIASIGPQTSLTCRELLGRVDIEATEYTLEGLTNALIQRFQGSP